MRIYRVDFHCESMGRVVSWHPNKAEAAAALRDLQKGRDFPVGQEDVRAVDIPTDKKGLIAWLNSNLAADNG